MEDPRIDKLESRLKDFERKRQLIGRDIMRVKDEMKLIVDEIFDDLFKRIEAHTEETDRKIDAYIADYRGLLNKRSEINAMKEKLTPVFEMIKSMAA